MSEVQVYETLKKITYDNLQQFIEDINRNFAIIQNSPLYKGLPGKAGDPGDPGLRGTRGSIFFFVDTTKFNEQFPGEIVNGSVINLEFLNSKIQNFELKNKLLQALGATELVDGDIIVLTNSIMIQYILLEDIFKDTGIAFNQQSNLVSSIETKIEQYVKYYVDNNPSILSIQNIFEHYITYAKSYATTNNTYLSNVQTKSSVYMPYIAGITDTQGVKLENHKYFGFADKEFPEANNGTIVFGSLKRYARLMLDTVSTTSQNTYTSDYAPGENNIPSAIFLQDTNEAGLMFGRKNSANLKRFGMIYKDVDDNLVIKSDMGKLLTDYSSIILNKNFLKYSKTVYFEDDLNLSKDLLHVGNTDNKFYRTAEYIHDARDFGPIDLTEGTQEQVTNASESRRKIMEVGYWLRNEQTSAGKDSEYRNLNETIKLPWFVSNVLVTDEKGEILKTYFVEKKDISKYEKSISNENLNNITWTGTEPADHAILTSNYLNVIIKKINAIQEYSLINYWRKDEYNPGRGESAKIPDLSLKNNLYVNGITILGTWNDVTRQYLRITDDMTKLTLGTSISNAIVELVSNNVRLTGYQGKNNLVLVLDNVGNIVKTYFRETYDINDKSIDETTLSKLNTDKNFLTSNYLYWLIEQLRDSNNNLADNYWRKEEYAPVTPKIPAIKLINSVQSNQYLTPNKMLDLNETDNYANLLFNEVYIGKDDVFSKLLLKSYKIGFPQQTKGAFLFLDNDGYLSQTDWAYKPLTDTMPDSIETLPQTINIAAPYRVVTADYLNNLYKILYNYYTTVLDDYWKKEDYVGFKIPNLELSGHLFVNGSMRIGLLKGGIVYTINNDTFEIGARNWLIDSSEITFKQSKFFNKVLCTAWDGIIRDDVMLSVNTSSIVYRDGDMPESSKDNPGNVLTQNPQRTTSANTVITGQQFAWLYKVIDNIKKRFRNTFNRKESIDKMYEHLPVGSIIIWTKASSLAAGLQEGEIPTGWTVCNGKKLPNSDIITPDLRSKFILGTDVNGSAYIYNIDNNSDTYSIVNYSETYGYGAIKINKENLPGHSHMVNLDKLTYYSLSCISKPKLTQEFGDNSELYVMFYAPHQNVDESFFTENYPDIISGYKYNWNENWGKPGAKKFDKGGNFGSCLWRTRVRKKVFNNSPSADPYYNGGVTFNLYDMLSVGANNIAFNFGEVMSNNNKTSNNIIKILPHCYTAVYIMKYDTRGDKSTGGANKGYIDPDYTLV